LSTGLEGWCVEGGWDVMDPEYAGEIVYWMYFPPTHMES
jgi:hypothetical protein